MEVRILKNNRILAQLPDDSYYLSKEEFDSDAEIISSEGDIKINGSIYTLYYDFTEITKIDALEYLIDF